jgi:hypothetical protein
MKKNVGTIDMIIRLIIGIAIGVWGLMNSNWLGLIGIIPIATGLMNFCPLYTVFGIGTCKIESN